MKRIISRELFDTDDMENIWETDLGPASHSDFNYHNITLFMDNDGKFFIAHYYYYHGDNTLQKIDSIGSVYDLLEDRNADVDDELMEILRKASTS